MISQPTYFAVKSFQRIVKQTKIRGLARLALFTRPLILGNKLRVLPFQNRFRLLCDCASSYEVLISYGLLHQSMDQLLSRLITETSEAVEFFDIGANIGFVSLLACSLDSARVRAHCFEPNPQAFERLKRNAELNPFNMILNPFALGAQSAQSILTQGTASSNSTLVAGGFAGIASTGTVMVEVQTLDEYCQRHGVRPALIKIDVEGFEPYVLQGGRQTILHSRPVLLIEINSRALHSGGYSSIELVAALAELGYTLYHIDLSQMQGPVPMRDAREQWNGYLQLLPEDCIKPHLYDIVAIPNII